MTATIYQFPVRAHAAEAFSIEDARMDPSERRVRQLVAILERAIDSPQTEPERRFANNIALVIQSNRKA
jgi:hypothetical protein